ncbi:hypothetical protein F4818DRAFT_129603 [Hypoxylon cercidicola]|nr:hypothetical protein F4818DRAFT_129603 [Hypoxylon cercidicola]
MEPQPRKRRRPALSCLECRRRKIKCDRNQPCAHCVSSRSQCSFKAYRDDDVSAQQPHQTSGNSWVSTSSPTAYAPTPLSQPPPINRDIYMDKPTPNRNNHQLATPGTAAAATAVEGHHDTPSTPSRNYSGPQSRAEEAENTSQVALQDLLQRVQTLESSASRVNPRQSETGQDILERQSGIQHSRVILKKTRVLNWSDWISHSIGHTQELGPIYDCYAAAMCNETGDGDSSQDPETRSLHVQIGDLLQKCKSIARRMKMGRPSRNMPCAEFNLEPPPREMAETMATLYFRSFESTCRILHVPSFWSEYHKCWNDPGSVTIGQRLQILLVIGIGSSLHKRGDADIEFRNKVHQWVYAAQTWLSGPLEKDRLNITGLQVHCLTLLARQVFSIGSDLVWMSMGSLVHRAMQIGLHRDPKHLPPMTVLQAELRRRLWTTILEMAVQMSLDSAMPPRISFDEFDTEAPSNINDDDIDASTTTLQPHPKSTFTATAMQLLLLDSLPTRLRIVQLINGLHSELSYLDVLALSSEITDACRAWSGFLKENENAGVTPFHRNLLDFLVRRFLIPLHCTFASKARANPLFYYSLKVSLDTALAIVSPEPDEGFSHLEVIGGGMFREGIRCAVTVLSLELVFQTEAQRLDGTLHRNAQSREVIKQALKNRIALSLERIRQGETNIKTHMFLCMILAQVEAMEEGSPCDLKIARSAKESLELCHGLLQERVDSLSLPGPTDLGLTPPNFDGGLGGFEMNFDLDFFLRDEGFT